MSKKIIRRVYEKEWLSECHATLHPLIRRIYTARGIRSMQELERGLDHLLPFHTLSGINEAVIHLAEAIFQQQKILVIGDFDADGATSTAVAVRALRWFGLKKVDYLVPNRFDFGYGLTPELVEVAKSLDPALIVTVDNGIANHAGVMAAKALGIKVIITDHHLPAETLPIADAIVNPNQPGDRFQSKNMAGVGVIFYVMLALRRHLSDQHWFEKQAIPSPNMAHLLDLVALGTVADVVPLDHNNRILVYQGLKRICAEQCVPGISALLAVSQRHQRHVQASDLGFSVAPRLNAAGRLDDMSLGIECLLTEDKVHALELAEQLNQLNDARRDIEKTMQEQALHALANIHWQGVTPDAICLFDEEWHQGVIGILAGRIKDRLHRPVIVFAPSKGDELKGSARSIPGLHIRDVLAEVAAHHPNMMNKFGGHAMAAGLTLSRSVLTHFAEVFRQVAASKLTNLDLQNALHSDGELQPDELTLDMADLLCDAGPWGQGFPSPLFDGVFELVEQRLVVNKHLRLSLKKGNDVVTAIAFNVDINQWPNYRCHSVQLAYRVDRNEFRGKRQLQLIVEYIKAI